MKQTSSNFYDYIIWAVDDFNSLALLRQLGQNKDARILFLIIGNKKYAYSSKYCKSFIETKSIEEGFDYLINNFEKTNVKPIIFTSGDNVMVFMDKHRNDLEARFVVPGCHKQGDTEFYTDKYNMWTMAKNVGMFVPDCILATKRNYEQISDLKYPCLIKPSHETPGYYNEFKFKICKNKKQLDKTFKYVRNESVFVIQELIRCKQQLLVYGCRTTEGEILLAGSMLVDRFSETGSSSRGTIDSGLFGLIKKDLLNSFLENIDYCGLFSFEFGVVDNKAYFFEINLRNDGTSNFFYQSGSNIPLAFANSICKNVDKKLVASKQGIAIDDLFDYENVIKKRIRKKEWKSDFKRASYFKYFDQNDLIPYKLAKRKSRTQMIKDILLKKYRIYFVHILTKIGLKK